MSGRRVIAVASAISLMAGTAGAVAASQPTKVERWVAFRDGKVAAGIHVLYRYRGSCIGGSSADPRADAWRCIEGNEIVDPCFGSAAGIVVCPYGTPDSSDAVTIRLTKPLPLKLANPGGSLLARGPYAIVTATGLYCYRSTGASSILRGRRQTYYCAGSASVAGSPDRASRTWTIAVLTSPAATRYRRVAIASAWW